MSLIAFGIAQIAIDIEPLVRIIRNDAILHGPTHTVAGALILAPLAAVITRLLGPWILKAWAMLLDRENFGWLKDEPSMSNGPILAGALIGTLSHIFLDSLMHADMSPLAPFQFGNPLIHLISFDALHLSCLASGILGLFAWVYAKRHIHARRKT